MSLLLDTAVVDGEHRAVMLHSLLTQATGPHEVVVHGLGEDVRARLEYWQLNEDVTVLRQDSSGITHRRDARHDRHDSPDRVVFVLHQGGPGRYTHNDEVRRLQRGFLYVTDLSSHYSYERPGDGTALIVQLERSSLELSFEQVEEASRRLYASPLYPLVCHHMADLCSAAPALSDTDETHAVASATTHLAASMLQTALATELFAGQTVAQDYLVDRIRSFVKLNFARPDLDPPLIAAAHGISIRYLFKLWSGRDESLSETIARIRLEAAWRLVRTSPELPIAVVSARCGFANSSHFARRFRAMFDVSPNDARLGARQHAPH